MDIKPNIGIISSLKMNTRTVHIVVWVLLLKLSLARGTGMNWKNRMLGDAVQMLQGHKDFPADLAAVAQNEDNTVIPNFMRELYNNHRDRDVPTAGTFANTVRSINSEIGLVDAESMFIFNLSSVELSETHIQSEIHIFKRKRRPGQQITITLYELAPSYVSKVKTHDVSNTDVGWFRFSVSDAVKSCLSVRRNLPHILALGFTKTNSKGKPRPLHLKALIRYMSRPFLVVYTNSSLNVTYDHVTARIPPRQDLPNTFINPENGEQETFDSLIPKTKPNRKNSVFAKPNQDDVPTTPLQVFYPYGYRPSSSEEDESRFNTGSREEDETDLSAEPLEEPLQAAEKPDISHTNAEEELSKQEILDKKQTYDRKQNSIKDRFARSVEDNHLPEESAKVLLRNTETESEQNSLPNQRQQTLQDYSETVPEFDIFSEEYLQSQYFPKQETFNMRDSEKRRRRRKQMLKKSRNSQNRDPNQIPFPEEWDFDFDSQDASFNSDKYGEIVNSVYSNRRCGVKKLIFDFADIGWSEWIIEPAAFASNLCAGVCSFPDPLDKGISNHAALKSLIHAVGIHNDIPAPCCVPEVTSSQSILYIDHNKNIVFKNYQNMAVQSCKCV